MAKVKSQKEKDLEELKEKIKSAKSIVFSDYRGTTVKDMDTLRKNLRKENVFSKVYKLSLLKKAMEANSISAEGLDYKTPVIVSFSEQDEATPARVIKNLSKEVKTISILDGLLGKERMSKVQMMALADLPSKDQLRAQFMSVLNGPVSAFARVLKARAEKISEPVSAEAPVAVEAAAPTVSPEPVAA